MVSSPTHGSVSGEIPNLLYSLRIESASGVVLAGPVEMRGVQIIAPATVKVTARSLFLAVVAR